MAISVRSASQNMITGSATSYTVAVPTGVAAGDLLVAFTQCSGTVFSDLTSTDFTQTGSDFTNANSAPIGRVWLRTATGSEPSSYTFGKTANTIGGGIVIALTGASSASPVDAAVSWGNGAASTSHVAPSVSPAGVGSMLVCGWTGAQNTGTSYTVPGSMTEDGDQNTGLDVQGLATELLAASGPTGTRTATASTSGVFGWNAFSIAIKAAPAVRAPNPSVITPDSARRYRVRPNRPVVMRSSLVDPAVPGRFLPFFG